MENKIYRSRTIIHPGGEKFETPLLVPSFSSKGFSMVNTKKSIISECYGVMMVATGFIEETLLVSAYDLYHNLVPKPSEFKSARINIIDSGGYETSQIYDLSGINKYNHEIKSWDENKLKEVKNNDFTKHKQEISNLLSGEVVMRYYYQKGRLEYGLAHDEYVDAALIILSDTATYNSILKGTYSPED